MNTGGRHSGGTPAKPTSRKRRRATSTAERSAASPTLKRRTSTSSREKLMTPERYFATPGAARIAARAIAGSPTRISGAGTRLMRTRPSALGLGTHSADGYSTASCDDGPAGSSRCSEKVINMARQPPIRSRRRISISELHLETLAHSKRDTPRSRLPSTPTDPPARTSRCLQDDTLRAREPQCYRPLAPKNGAASDSATKAGIG